MSISESEINSVCVLKTIPLQPDEVCCVAACEDRRVVAVEMCSGVVVSEYVLYAVSQCM